MQAICEAIRLRRLLTFSYKGQRRTVEPHIHGSDNARRACLSAYQVGGGSNSGDVEGWKQFKVAEMSDVVLEERGFRGPREEYTRTDARFLYVHCQL